MKIRCAYLADHSEFTEIAARWAYDTWGRYNCDYTLEKRISSFREHAGKGRLPVTLIALDQKDQPLAMASLRADDGLENGRGPWLGSVFTLPQYRGLGLASTMCRAVEEEARSLGFEKIYLLTYETSLPNWYKKLGWIETGEDLCHGNKVTVMERTLSK